MKVEGIILAAGFSKRANAFKMTLNYKGKTIIENVIDGMLPYVDSITVVGGYKIEKLEPVIKKYEKVQLIFNEKYEEGMFSSIKKGISTVKGEGFFLTPGDYPLIEGFVYEKLLSIKGDIVIPVYNSKRGHPIFIKSSQIEKIKDKKYSNLREFINDNNPSYAYVDCIGILKDVDTMEDYKEILNLGGEAMGRDIALSIRRDDAIAKISGEAKYTCDVKFENMLYGKTLRSKIVRGKIKSIKYPSLPEGYYIVDKDDVPKPNKLKILKSDMSVFAQDVVNYVGEPIALVVGEDKEIIDDILSKIEVEYENIQPILTLEEGLNAKEPIYGDNNLFADYVVEKGDIKEVKNRASYVYEGEYETGYQEQFYLETQSIIADFKDEKITIYGSMQCPYYIKNALLDFFKVDNDKIRVVQFTTGGGFGGKEDYPSLIAAQAAVASIKCKRPVKIIYDRDEDIEFTTKRHPSKIKLKSYLDDNFKVIGMEADIILDGGAYASLSEVVLQRAMFAISGVYNIENLYVKGRAVATNKAISGAFRGFGAPQAFFAIEMHMEHIAKKFNLNPIDFKINNLIKRGDKSSTGGTFRDEIRLMEMIKRAEIMSSYNEKKSRFKEERKEGKLKGIGMSLFFHGGGFTGSGERDHIKAKVKLLKRIDETVEILISNVEMGQGAMTTSRKIVAYTLNIPIEKVIFENPDTDRVPDSGPTVASRTTVVVGELLREAAEELKNRWNENETLIVEANYRYPEGYEWDGEKLKGDAYTSYSFGVNVVEVEVDSITYESTIKNVYAVYDIGKAIDERIVRGQIDGGIVQGLGYAGIEVMENKDGRFLQRTSSDYIIPTSKDVPNIYSELLCEPFKYGPYGAKALGELTLVGSPPAYALSVEDALGIEISDIPVRPENILEVLRHGK